MNGNDLLEAMSFIDEAYLEEAEKEVRVIRFRWKPIAAAAACLVFACSGMFIYWQNARNLSRVPMLAAPAIVDRDSREMEEELAEDLAPMMLSASEQITVQLEYYADGYAVFLITQSQNSEYPVGSAIRVQMAEDPSSERYTLSFFPEEAEEDLLHPIEMIPAEEQDE